MSDYTPYGMTTVDGGKPAFIATVVRIDNLYLVECLRCSAMVPERSLPRHAENLHDESVVDEGNHMFRWSGKR